MSTINFPSSPSINDTYLFDGKTFVYDGTKWKIQRSTISTETNLLAVNNAIVPDTNIAYDLGSSSNRWRDLYLSGNTIDLNGVQISADETGVILPEGSKIGAEEIGSGSASASTLTKTFTENETASVTLANPVTVTPLVSATKEIPQTGIISKGGWDVRANGSNYSIYDFAYDDTLTPSDATANGTFTLGAGTFSADDVGKKITGNGGEVTLINADGSYVITTPFNDTNTIASGDWSMHALTFDDTDGVKLNSTLVNYDIENAVYDNKYYSRFSIDANESKPTGIVFSNDGSKMFIVGSNADRLVEYSLPVAFDVSTTVYVRYVNIVTDPAGIAFNDTGNKAYILAGSTVYQYSLATPYDSSTLVSDSITLSLSGSAGTRGDLVFNDDGTKLFVLTSTPDAIEQYSLSTPYDISTATYDNISLSVVDYDINPGGLAFNGDGTQLFTVGLSDTVRRWTLTTPYDLSTATYDNVTFSVSAQETSTSGLTFNNNGTKMYIIGNEGSLGGGSRTDGVAQYTVGDAYTPTGMHCTVTNSFGQIDSRFWTDVNDMTVDENLNDALSYYAISTDNHTTWSIIHNTNGTRNIVRNNNGTWEYNDANTFDGETWVSATINEEIPAIQESLEEGNAIKIVGFGDISNWTDDSVALSIPGTSGFAVNQQGSLEFSIDGLMMFAGTDNSRLVVYTLTTPFDISTASYQYYTDIFYRPFGIRFNNDGTKMYLADDNGNRVLEYTMPTPYDFDNASNTHTLGIFSQTENPVGLSFNDTGSVMYVVNYIGGRIYQYDLSTPFDLSTASYRNSFSVSSVEARPQDIAFNADGTKMYVGGERNDNVTQWSLSTPYDVTSATYDFASFAVADVSMRGMTISHDGTKMYTVGYSGVIRQHSIALQDNYNRMTSTQLNEVTDENHLTTGNSLDLAIILNTNDVFSIPESDGITINYDAEALNKSAVVGIDYEFDFPDSSTVRVTSLTDQNLKVKILEA